MKSFAAKLFVVGCLLAGLMTWGAAQG